MKLKIIKKYLRRRDWSKLTETQKQKFRSKGISPEQLEGKELKKNNQINEIVVDNGNGWVIRYY